MPANFDCFTAVQGFFLATTVLFGIVCLILLNRLGGLKKKLSDMLETLAAKDKELSKTKADAQTLLSPFIPETSRSIIVSLDPDGIITDTNDYACELFGYTKDELIGQKAFGLIYPLHAEKEALQNNIIQRIFANPKLYVEHETENVKKSGEHFWISWTNRIMYDDSGKPTELRSVGFDITKRKRLEEELKYLASVDPQTGVLNRQSTLESGIRELKRSIRYRRDFSVLILQLDYFRGADAQAVFSDEIVHQVVSIIQQSIRDSDYIGRIGDVEFAVLLPETSKEHAWVVADRIKQRVHEENLHNDNNLFVTTRFGLAEKTNSKETFDDLLLNALADLSKSGKEKTSKTKKGS